MDIATDDMMHLAENQGRHADDHTLLVRFFMHPKQDIDKSRLQGRPIFKDVPHIEITAPGSRAPQVVRAATKRDIMRFPEHYAKFEARESQEITEGTPLAEWPGISRSQVENFRFLNILTVEQLANVPDSKLSGIMGGMSMKQRAAAYLDASKDNAQAEALVDANARIDALQKTVEDLLKLNKDLQEQVQLQPKRRGRPAKLPDEAEQ